MRYEHSLATLDIVRKFRPEDHTNKNLYFLSDKLKSKSMDIKEVCLSDTDMRISPVDITYDDLNQVQTDVVPFFKEFKQKFLRQQNNQDNFMDLIQQLINLRFDKRQPSIFKQQNSLKFIFRFSDEYLNLNSPLELIFTCHPSILRELHDRQDIDPAVALRSNVFEQTNDKQIDSVENLQPQQTPTDNTEDTSHSTNETRIHVQPTPPSPTDNLETQISTGASLLGEVDREFTHRQSSSTSIKHDDINE